MPFNHISWSSTCAILCANFLSVFFFSFTEDPTLVPLSGRACCPEQRSHCPHHYRCFSIIFIKTKPFGKVSCELIDLTEIHNSQWNISVEHTAKFLVTYTTCLQLCNNVRDKSFGSCGLCRSVLCPVSGHAGNPACRVHSGQRKWAPHYHLYMHAGPGSLQHYQLQWVCLSQPPILHVGAQHRPQHSDLQASDSVVHLTTQRRTPAEQLRGPPPGTGQVQLSKRYFASCSLLHSEEAGEALCLIPILDAWAEPWYCAG